MRVFLFTLLIATVASVIAAPPSQDVTADSAKNKAQAAKQAKQKFPGRVLKVEQRQTTFRVKLLQKSGRVVTIEIKRTVHIHTPNKKKVP